jgi:hypothetical protein
MAGAITGTKIDLVESSGADLPPAGTTRIIRKGGVTQQSVDGAAFAAIAGGAATEYYASLTAGAATSLTLSGLNGDADGIYLVRMYIKSVQAANNIKIQVNGADTNLNCIVGDQLHGSVLTLGSWTIQRVSATPAPFGVGEYLNLVGIFSARTPRKRIWEAAGFGNPGAAGNGFILYGEYNDTSTNLTSLSIVGSVATGLDPETFIHAVRIQSSNPLA